MTHEREQQVSQDRPVSATNRPTNPAESKQQETIATHLGAGSPSSHDGDGLLPPGRMLGQYRILERLGSGGMGQVYKAVHLVMERTVALKIISPRLMQEELVCARFQREVRTAARLIHPHIVVAHDAAQAEGMWFLVMEHIEGKDVGRLLSKFGRPPVGLACEIVRQAALGLEYAYECGMVHRDIKPANLMVTTLPPPAASRDWVDWPEAPLVKILDFGLARLSAAGSDGLASADALTREGHVVGTPEYMAPEQARDSGRVDIRSDIYSLGCTLYTLLAGRPPFKALSAFELAVMHLNDTPEPIGRFHPGLPVELSTLVHRLLAKHPEQRLQTPAQVANAMQLWARSAARPAAAAAGSSGPSLASSTPALAAAQPTPSRLPQQLSAMPPDVMMMHFHAMLRTLLLLVIIAVVGLGSVLYLPDIGNGLLQLWNRVTPQTTKTAPPR
jgi:eukaryotic-like serine/threonine-protein kinase